MKILTISATSAGAGASTLAALIYLLAQGQQTGAPTLYTAPGSNLFQRLPTVTPRIVNPESVIWDAGVGTPGSVVGLMRTSTLLAVATPATPLGHADALNFVRAVGTSPQDLQRIVIVTMAVYGSQRSPAAALPVTHLHIPNDQTLAKPGPVPADLSTYSRKTRSMFPQLATIMNIGL